MASTKTTALTADTAPSTDDLLYTINDPGGTPASRKVTISNFLNVVHGNVNTNAETASFTFADGDQGKVNTISNAGATTATIPPNATVAFPTNTILVLCQIGAGACTWTEGSGVTINTNTDKYSVNGNGEPTTGGQYSYSFARKTGTNTWEVGGDLVLLNPLLDWTFVLGDESTALTASTTTPKLTWYTPYAITLTDIKGMVTVAPTDATMILDVHEAGTTIMATNKVDILTTALTDDGTATLSDTALAAGAKMEFFVDQIGSTIAGAGAKITLIGRRT